MTFPDIEQLTKLSKGEILAPQVRIVAKSKKPLIISRPVQKQYLLELNKDGETSTSCQLTKMNERITQRMREALEKLTGKRLMHEPMIKRKFQKWIFVKFVQGL